MKWFNPFKQQTQNPKPKSKVTLWYVIFLAVLLWTILQNLWKWGGLLPNVWQNHVVKTMNVITPFEIIVQIVFLAIALFGVIWLVRIYIRSIKDDKNKK